ncbi:MAG: polyprenyl synthetase family protein, partial [bacterium]|nr:polyprenyl synthetase family protein [bacterium]
MDFALSKAQQQFLDEVENSLSQVLHNKSEVLPLSNDVILAASRHLCLGANAKRIRPLLTLFFGSALCLKFSDLLPIAVAGELMHSASLLHDDVIDEAKLRRGRPAVSYQYGNATAVLSGNFLLSVAFSLLKDQQNDLIHDSVDAIAYMAKAAIAEIDMRGKIDTELNVWKEVALGKTGVLFAWCGRSVGRIANNAEAIHKFYQCGLHIGTAFQLVDDLRDLQDAASLKDRFSDIKNREPSYPILLASRSPEIKKEIMSLWSQPEMSAEQIDKLGYLI